MAYPLIPLLLGAVSDDPVVRSHQLLVNQQSDRQKDVRVIDHDPVLYRHACCMHASTQYAYITTNSLHYRTYMSAAFMLYISDFCYTCTSKIIQPVTETSSTYDKLNALQQNIHSAHV